MDIFLISKKNNFLYKLITSRKIEIIYSAELLEELRLVCKRKKFINYFDNEDVLNITNMIVKYGILVGISSTLDLCRDKKDNYLINLAVDSKADFLISGDKDILILNNLVDTSIMKYKEFEGIAVNFI